MKLDTSIKYIQKDHIHKLTGVVVKGLQCIPDGNLRLNWGISQVSQTSPKQSITVPGFRQAVQPPDTANHQNTFETPSTREKVTTLKGPEIKQF